MDSDLEHSSLIGVVGLACMIVHSRLERTVGQKMFKEGVISYSGSSVSSSTDKQLYGLLTDGQITKNLFPGGLIEAKHLWENGSWAKIGDKIFIDPFNSANLQPISYDLSIGNQYLTPRRSDVPVDIGPEGITLEPGESSLVLTKEYVALPKNIAGMVEAKARMIFEGILLNSTRVEPTWYGRLAIGISNNSNGSVKLKLGEPFCTLLLSRLSDNVEVPLRKQETHHLGQEVIEIRTIYVNKWDPKKAEDVTPDDMKNAVERYGPPFDIVNGMFENTFNRVKQHLIKRWGPGFARDMEMNMLKWKENILMESKKDARHFTTIFCALVAAIFSAMLLAITVILWILS